jgi:RNA polymerase sigma-70 factor (ECF subfamily)
VNALGGSEHRVAFGVAYRILGSVHDAEDAVQEAAARWHRLPEEQRAQVREPAAWLTRVVSRICLDELASARARRERYTGIWLPEPILGTVDPARRHVGMDPADSVTLDESVSMALLVAMEELTPGERVCLILHDVFQLPFDEIAEIVGRSAASCRQLASSARRSVRSRPQHEAPSPQRNAVVAAFAKACFEGDLEALVRVLDPRVVSRADGGEHIRAARKVVIGAEVVANYLLNVMQKQRSATQNLRPSLEPVNGRTGIVVRDGDAVIAVVDLEIASGAVTEIAMVVNPDKLSRLV